MKNLKSIFIALILLGLVSCDKEDRVYKSVTGSWRCEEFNPLFGISVYMVDIDRKKSDTTLYLLSNFHNQDSEESIEFVYAKLLDSTLTISMQSFAGLVVKSGIGAVSSDFTLIEFDYEIFDGVNDISVHAVYSRPD